MTMLVMLLVLQVVVDSFLAALGGSRLPMGIAAAALSMLGLAVALAWWGFGQQIVSIGELLLAPAYVFGKLPVYVRIISRGKSEWVRTKRDVGKD